LPSEPPLDGIKESDPFVWRLEATNAPQQYGRYKTDPADPQDDRKNVQRAGNRNIIHLPSLDLRRSVGLREAGMTLWVNRGGDHWQDTAAYVRSAPKTDK
jgi:hypothetical protein